MSVSDLDFIFPFIVFFYGVFMCFVLASSSLKNLAQKLNYQPYTRLLLRGEFAAFCMLIGGLWSLQNLWF